MSWRTKMLPLTDDQINRGVVYSSRLIVSNYRAGSVLHEVYADDPDKQRKIRNLEDVTFFKNMANEMNWNVVNEVHRKETENE